MTALDKMRDAFETCTVMAGVEPDFECIYITKAAADMLFESDCAIDGDRVTWYAAWLDRSPNLLYSTLKRLGCVEVGFDELERRVEILQRIVEMHQSKLEEIGGNNEIQARTR